MRRILCVLSLLFCCSVYAFDWKPQGNLELRTDMIAFAEGSAGRAAGTPQGMILRRFVRRQKHQAGRRPYAWIADTRDVVRRLEELCPPCVDDGSPEARMRRDILLLLDYPLHSDNMAKDASGNLLEAFAHVSESYRFEARARALAFLDEPAPADGVLKLLKVYNMGFIARSSKRTFVFDLSWEGSAAEAACIASKSDVFFLSHPHKDHYSDVLISAFADAGKAVVLPSDLIPGREWDGKTVVGDDILAPADICGITVQVLRGFQSDRGGRLPNNGYLLEFDGWRLWLPGENEDAPVDSAFVNFAAPDLLVAPSWNSLDRTFGILRSMPGYDADTVWFIPAHENELRHSVNHRESYRELFSRQDRLGAPETAYPRIILQDIGEFVTLYKQ